jgi:hypothetical protein
MCRWVVVRCAVECKAEWQQMWGDARDVGTVGGVR